MRRKPFHGRVICKVMSLSSLGRPTTCKFGCGPALEDLRGGLTGLVSDQGIRAAGGSAPAVRRDRDTFVVCTDSQRSEKKRKEEEENVGQSTPEFGSEASRGMRTSWSRSCRLDAGRGDAGATKGDDPLYLSAVPFRPVAREVSRERDPQKADASQVLGIAEHRMRDPHSRHHLQTSCPWQHRREPLGRMESLLDLYDRSIRMDLQWQCRPTNRRNRPRCCVGCSLLRPTGLRLASYQIGGAIGLSSAHAV